MKKIFLSLILPYFYQHLSAQCPASGNFYATQQVEIDDFQTNYPGCTSLTGSLHISLNDNITNLGPLSVLLSVGGDVWIQDLQYLPSLSGLDNLTAIGGDLRIENADSLLSLFGLTSLQSVGGNVFIRDNSQLQTFGGLGSLQTIGGYLEIDINQKLIMLDGGEIATLQFTASTTIDSVLNGVSGFSIYEAVNSSGSQLYFDLHDTTIVVDGAPEFVEDHANKIFFSIYPNPFGDQLVIRATELKGEATLLIFDATGKEIYSAILTNASFTLSTADWDAGIYFYQLKSGATMAHGKLAKE